MPYIVDVITVIAARMLGIAQESPMWDRLDEFKYSSSTPECYSSKKIETWWHNPLANANMPLPVDQSVTGVLLVAVTNVRLS